MYHVAGGAPTHRSKRLASLVELSFSGGFSVTSCSCSVVILVRVPYSAVPQDGTKNDPQSGGTIRPQKWDHPIKTIQHN